MDDVAFRALADPHRRTLLDTLRRHDDQTLGELCAGMPMTRQAVSKHLAVLVDAHLVVVRRDGRTRRHMLDPRPLRAITSWLEDYAGLWESRLDALERHLDG